MEAVGDGLLACVTVDNVTKGGDAFGDLFRLAEYGGESFFGGDVLVLVLDVLAVEDFDFGIGADVGGAGFGLELNTLATQRGEHAGSFADGDDGGGFADAHDTAGFAVKLDDVSGL